MTSTRTRVRRAAGLGGLLAGIALVVALKVVTASSATTTGGQVALPPGPARPLPSVTRSAGAPPPPPKVIDGDVAQTPYGPVQVQVTIAGGRITEVRALQTPSDASRSVRLAAMATPILRQEVLQAQSARIDTVSGATYTSQGYAESVQYALDHATA